MLAPKRLCGERILWDMTDPDTIVKRPPSQDLPGCVSLPIMLALAWLMISLITGDWNTYRVLNSWGWIEHDHDTPVWIDGEWLSGEYRMCLMPGPQWGELPAYAHLLCGKGLLNAEDGIWPAGFRYRLSDEEFDGIFIRGHWDSVEHYFHVLPVEYWGRIDRTDRTRTTFSWSCQKRISGLVCKAMN